MTAHRHEFTADDITALLAELDGRLTEDVDAAQRLRRDVDAAVAGRGPRTTD